MDERGARRRASVESSAGQEERVFRQRAADRRLPEVGRRGVGHHRAVGQEFNKASVLMRHFG